MEIPMNPEPLTFVAADPSDGSAALDFCLKGEDRHAKRTPVAVDITVAKAQRVLLTVVVDQEAP